jgi:TetR/AcrR family transcriptional regulator, transcriptional repressor for nem operon
MRYSENHKQETREKVLKIAAKALREKGPDRLGVAEVMAAAGLTHGGFYAHFPSKDDFLAATLKEVFDHSAARRMKVVGDLPPKAALSAYIDFYVSRGHRDHPGAGCPIAALNSELPRQSEKFRAEFDAGVKRLLAKLGEWIGAIGLDEREKQATALLSAMVGAVALSRAVADPQLSDDLLASAREGIKKRFGLAGQGDRQ